MSFRIIDISSDRTHLALFRGFLRIKKIDGHESDKTDVPLDEISAVIANAHGLSYTNNILVELADRGIPFVLCGSNHNPMGFIWPVSGNHLQSKRFDAQIAAQKPLKKRLWKQIVASKIANQARVLEIADKPSQALNKMTTKLTSGDGANIEAQAARYYWRTLFGKSFRRDQSSGGLNSLLNYGYTILRAGVARSIIAGGLHPTVGLHHTNESNPMRLADDLMEPFRPVIDLTVWKIWNSVALVELDRDTKRTLAVSMQSELLVDKGANIMSEAIHRLVLSLVHVFLGEEKRLLTPLIIKDRKCA